MHAPRPTRTNGRRTAAMLAHPAGRDGNAAATPPDPSNRDVSPNDAGSLVAEYGLVAVVGATVASLAIKWASGGSIFELFGAVLKKVKVLVGA